MWSGALPNPILLEHKRERVKVNETEDSRDGRVSPHMPVLDRSDDDLLLCGCSGYLTRRVFVMSIVVMTGEAHATIFLTFFMRGCL